MPLNQAQRRQVGFISLGAAAIYVGFRFLPTGTNLNHMDFRVNAKNAIDFCDPLSPQFIPVVAVTSPVALTLASDAPAAAGKVANLRITLRTASGKRIEPADLLVAHTKRLHLLIVDPTLTDYQHVHPEPTKTPGEWAFAFTPHAGGNYRVFADFTPAATGRGLYASADLTVSGTGIADLKRETTAAVEREGFRFTLQPVSSPVRAGRTADLKFTVARSGGGDVPLEPVMGAFAHLVAFDETRSGFAHLHPMETDLLQRPGGMRPELSFKITIPRAGRYVIWSQVNLAGRELFVPFWFEVAP